MMSSISKRRREGTKSKIKSLGDHKEFLKRISKSLYYGQLPALPCLSLPVTEISCEVWSAAQAGRSLRRLRRDEAAAVARAACVSPCALVLALLYLERLNACNPDYLTKVHPSELFLVSLMVGSKFLQDDGEDEEVLCSEWAASGGLQLPQLKQLELDFLSAIDWKVFVNDESFETGLGWLEKQVALRQSLLHGFCTYADVAAAGGLRAGLRTAAAAWLSAALAYLAGLALLAAACLLCAPAAPAAHTAPAARPSTARDAPLPHVNNSTDLTDRDAMPSEIDITDLENNLLAGNRCCSEWQSYRQIVEPVKTWHNSGMLNERESFDTWWSETSVLNWLYQSSMINPMQRWLEKLDDYGIQFGADGGAGGGLGCAAPAGPRRRCEKQWLHLNKFSALVMSVSDR